MDDDAAVSLALSAAQDLSGMASDVGSIKEALSDYLSRQPAEVPLPGDDETDGAEAAPVVYEVQAAGDGSSALHHAEVMGALATQTLLLVVIGVAVCLSVGAQLWQSFSDKWRF